MRFTDARNDKPPMKGVDAADGLPIRLGCRVSVEGSLTDCSSSVNHPTTPTYSGTLDGETTRRVTLNLDRGGQPLDTRREAGKREWHRGNSAKVARSGWLRQSSIPHDPELGAIRLKLRADSPSVINS